MLLVIQRVQFSVDELTEQLSLLSMVTVVRMLLLLLLLYENEINLRIHFHAKLSNENKYLKDIFHRELTNNSYSNVMFVSEFNFITRKLWR